MKQLFAILILMISCHLIGQEGFQMIEGEVSFVSSRNVYVKYVSTRGIEIGDTLFLKKDELYSATLIVNNKSSSSTVCHILNPEKIEKGIKVYARIKLPEQKKDNREPVAKKDKEAIVTIEEEMIPIQEEIENENDIVYKQKVKAKLSASSYSTFADYENNHRMRYGFSFSGDHINNSKISVDNHITFRHTLNEWDQVSGNLSQALKIYSLCVKYDFNSSSSLLFGRKINPKISSMGAIDGFQFEKSFGLISMGVMAGSRPDYSDYSFNLDLMQTGAYVSINSSNPGKYHQTTLGLVEQRNQMHTDRRFAYFQHSSEPVQNLHAFGSFEMDLFENIHNETKNTLRLTNFYLSLRYKISKKIRVSAAYDNRKNIIYYESYKSFIDRLIEDETRQGLRFGLDFKPNTKISWGLTSSFRFQSNHETVTKNYNSYLSFSKVPILNLRAAIRVNYLETDYLKSQIYGLRISKNLIRQKMSGDLYFRYVNYTYKRNNVDVQHKIAGVSLSYRLMQKLSLYLYYEATLDNSNKLLSRVNTKVIQRF